MPARGFAAFHVRGGFGLDHLQRHPQRKVAVDRTQAAEDLAVVVLDDDLVAEEVGRVCPAVGDQGFLP